MHLAVLHIPLFLPVTLPGLTLCLAILRRAILLITWSRARSTQETSRATGSINRHFSTSCYRPRYSYSVRTVVAWQNWVVAPKRCNITGDFRL